jgi:hypothetical protein
MSAKVSWLKTVGMDILKGIQFATAIATGVDPLIQNTAVGSKVSAVTSELATIGNVVTIVESTAAALGSGTGVSKLSAALPYVSSLIQASELMVGKQVSDEAGFEAGCTQVINGVVAILNSVKAQNQKTTPAQPILPTPALPTPGAPKL